MVARAALAAARVLTDDAEVGRAALAAATVLTDDAGRVLLVRHTYGRLNWEIPGGLAMPGETLDETARRELLEETGLEVGTLRLAGLYLEPGHDLGTMLHGAFLAKLPSGAAARPTSDEIDEVGWFHPTTLPGPISDFTERRIAEALADLAGGSVVRLADASVVLARISERTWRDF